MPQCRQGGALAVSVSVVRGFALAALTRPAGTGQAAAAAYQRSVEHTLNRAPAGGGLPWIGWCLALASGRKDRPELGWGAASMVAASTVAASTVAVTPKCDADCHVCFEKVRFNLSLPFQRFSENCQSNSRSILRKVMPRSVLARGLPQRSHNAQHSSSARRSMCQSADCRARFSRCLMYSRA